MNCKLEEAINNAEQALGFHVPSYIAAEVLLFSIRKCNAVGKDYSYLPLLYEAELLDFFMRESINAKYERMYCNV